MAEEGPLFVGVDVGTGSVRAALFEQNGRMLANYSKDISIRSPKTDFYEQSSEEIWSSVCEVVRKAVDKIDSSRVKGVGFDATW